MNRKALLLVIHVLSILIVFRLISITAADFSRKSHDPQGLDLALRLTPGNAQNYYTLGLISHYQLLEPDINDAISYYNAALRRTPLYSRAWLDLARAYQSANKPEKSRTAIQNFYRLNRRNPERIWETGVFYLVESGRIETAMDYFKQFVELRPESQSRVYDLFSQMKVPIRHIINHFLSDKTSLYPEYLRYLMRHERTDDAIMFWNSVNHQIFSEQSRLELCNFLIASRRYDVAIDIWRELSKREGSSPEGGLIANGSFESDPKNSCFSWVIGESEGVATYFDGSVYSAGYRSLGISFDGEHNMDITVVKQHVPIEPGSEYVLKADIKTDNLTTTNGLFFEARGHDCDGLYVTTEAVTGTNLWRPVIMRFSAPDECSVVDISLRRQKSRKFNNKIKGEAWVDGLELRKAADKHG